MSEVLLLYEKQPLPMHIQSPLTGRRVYSSFVRLYEEEEHGEITVTITMAQFIRELVARRSYDSTVYLRIGNTKKKSRSRSRCHSSMGADECPAPGHIVQMQAPDDT